MNLASSFLFNNQNCVQMYIFKCYGRELTLFFEINKHTRSVHFTDMGTTSKEGVFSTDSEALASAMLKSKQCGRLYYLASGKKKESAPDSPNVEPIATYPEVKRVQDAIKILVEKYEIEEDTISNKSDVKRIARSLNISFPGLK